MMKRNLLLLLLLLTLGALAYFLLPQEDVKSTLSKNDRDFRIEDVSQIGSIRIETRRREDLLLRRSGKDWLINNKHVASPNAIGRLLEVVKDMRLQYIPHNNALKNIKNEMELVGLHVKIFDKEGVKMKDYWIGGGTADERGTYVQMEGSNQPYVMELPTFEGSIRQRFIPTAEQWRDRRFLHEDVSKIASIKVEYPKSQSDSFVLDVDNAKVDPLNPLTKGGRNIRKGAIQAYLRAFEKIGAESIENDHNQRDSISRLVPFAKFTIEYSNGDSKWFNMFPLKDIEMQEVNTMSIEQTARIERYLIDCSWNDFLLVQQRLVKNILRPAEFFFEPGKQ